MSISDDTIIVRGKWGSRTLQEVKLAIAESRNIEEAIHRCRLRVGSDMRGKFNTFVIAYGIDTSHFNKLPKQYSDSEIFKLDSVASQKVLLARYKKKYPAKECKCCKKSASTLTAAGEPIKFILDHINGNNTDNRLENLRWVCGDCNIGLPTTNKGMKGVDMPIIRKQKNNNLNKFFTV